MRRWQRSMLVAEPLTVAPVLALATAICAVLFSFCWLDTSALGDTGSQPSARSPNPIWSELLQKTPYPHTAPLPPPNPTPLDATYVKFDPKETPPVHCRRCPDYASEGGIWKLGLERGIFRIFHEATGWRSIGSFIVEANRVQFFNDPCCLDDTGTYTWNLIDGRLHLTVVEDQCAIGLRAMNLMQLLWLSCRPPSTKTTGTDHWTQPAGCE